MAFSQPVNVGNIQEWQSMMFGEFFGKLFLALVLGFIVAQITLRPAWRLEELVLFFAGVVAACLHVRFVLVFVPFCAPLFAVIVARWIPPYEPAKDKYALNAILMASVVAGVVWFFPCPRRLAKRHGGEVAGEGGGVSEGSTRLPSPCSTTMVMAVI